MTLFRFLYNPKSTAFMVSAWIHGALLMTFTSVWVFQPVEEAPARTILQFKKHRAVPMTGMSRFEPRVCATFAAPSAAESDPGGFVDAIGMNPIFPKSQPAAERRPIRGHCTNRIGDEAWSGKSQIVAPMSGCGIPWKGPLTTYPSGCGGSILTGCVAHKGACTAVLGALDWLARHQNPDGSWSVKGYVDRCETPCTPNPGEKDYTVGVTGLALLAFSNAGYTYRTSGSEEAVRHAEVVRRGIQYVLSKQDPDGCFGSRNAPKYMYNHAVCTLALSQLYGQTGTKLFRDQVQHAVDFLVAARNPGLGWRYSMQSGDTDTSVTGWAVLALTSAGNAGLCFPRSATQGAMTWFNTVTDRTYGRTGYNSRGTGCRLIIMPQPFDPHESMTAMAIAARILMTGSADFGDVPNANAILYRDLPKWGETSVDFYYWFAGTLTVFQ